MNRDLTDQVGHCLIESVWEVMRRQGIALEQNFTAKEQTQIVLLRRIAEKSLQEIVALIETARERENDSRGSS